MDHSCVDAGASPDGSLLNRRPDWSNDDEARERRLRVTTTLFGISLIVAIVTSCCFGYSLFKLRQMEGRERHPYACCRSGSPLGAAPASMVPCRWNRTKDAGMIIAKSLATSLTKECVDNSFHVAYVESHVDIYSSEIIKTDKLRSIDNWLLRGVGCRLGESVDYDEARGEFTIARSGDYVVYSHVTFQPPPDVIYRLQMDGESREFAFRHVVSIRRSDRQHRTEVLEDRLRVTCPTVQMHAGVPHPCHVTDQAAILRLERGDVLTVEVAPIRYVLGDMASTYFGSVLLK